jgi:CheY-like chemotaxis protein
VIINLISNAVKFTEQGEIKVSVRQVGGDLLNAQVRFEVRDTGTGIRPESRATIFDSFAQEDNSITRQHGGSGLGLAICKQLVELMGGQIGIDSTVGVGSTFHFTVPLAIDPTTVRELRPGVLERARMLIVDDSVTNREIVGGHLRSWGIVVTEASSGRDALGLLDRALGGQFDALLLDGQMPDMDGAALARAIRGHRDFSEVPLLIMNTVLAVPPAAESAQHANTVWLNKPVRRAPLHDGLTRLLERRAGGDRQPAPAATQPGSESAPQRVAQVPGVRRVLLVEDNVVNQEVARAMLQELSIDAVSAWSGAEALDLLGADTYDAVLMDCQMPKLDGYETTRRFREWEQAQKRPHTLVVALTANALQGDAEKCLAAGMDRYLSKPFSIEQLRQSLAADETVQIPVPANFGNAVLDPQTINRIRALRRPGGPDLFIRVVDLYVSSSGALIDTMCTCARGEDTSALAHAAQAAHALKSSSANIGAIAFAGLCSEVEAAANAGDAEQTRALVHRVLGEHRQVLRALEAQEIAA